MKAGAQEMGSKFQQKKAVALSLYSTYKTAKNLKKAEEEKAKKLAAEGVKEEEKKEEDQNPDEPTAQQKEDMMAMSGNMIDVAWNITVLDIESTLRTAISKIFRDRSVDEKGKKQRAKALLKLSKIYEQYGEESDKGLEEMKEMIKG